MFPGLQGGPLMHVIAAKAVAFGEALTHDFKVYQEHVLENARVLATRAAGARPAHRVRRHRLAHVPGRPAREEDHRQGRRGGAGRAHITVNKNAIPNDPEKPFVTSGIRIGSPAITTRGFTEIECEELAHLIADVLDAPDDDACTHRASRRSDAARDRASTSNAFPVLRREPRRNEVPVLRQRRYAGHRFARLRSRATRSAAAAAASPARSASPPTRRRSCACRRS